MRIIFIVSFFCTYLCTTAQQYYVGVPVNDTLLTIGFGDYNYGCYPDYTQSFYVQNQFFPYVTGLNVGLKITHNLPVGDLTTQYGVVNSGDTLAISSSQIGYEFYFASQGSVLINWIVYGTPLVLNESYICGPWFACASAATCKNWVFFSSNYCFGIPNYCSVQPAFEFVQNEEICYGNIFSWRGNNYSVAGTYYDSLVASYGGYDSVYILNLTVNPVYEFTQTENICDGDTITWRSNDYYATGIYYDSLTTVHGCDSIYILDLTVHPNHVFIDSAEICVGDIFSWRGNDYTLEGTYYDSLLTVNGCDSVFILELTVFDLPVVSISGLDTFYCVYHDVVVLTGTPAGGTFSGQGVSGNQFDPASAGIGTWDITYSFTDTNSCVNIVIFSIEVDACVGIVANEKLNIKLYPNPNDGNFMMELHEESFITVFSNLGTIVYEGLFVEGTHPFHLNHLANDVYYIKAEGKRTTDVIRIVVNK